MTVCAFVAPYLMPATVRFLAATASLPGVDVAVITTEPADHLTGDLRARLAGHWQLPNAMDPAQIAEAVRGLSRQIGPVQRLFAALEQLQVPLGRVRDALDIPGMDAATAYNFRDKAHMKSVLRSAGVPCARHRLATSAADPVQFADEVGFPLVVKPPAGAGARSTFRIDDAAALHLWLDAAPPSDSQPALVEEFLTGSEGCFDSVTIDGRVVWHSISDYRPSPLEVLRNPWIQWTVQMPRRIDGPEYAEISEVGPAALRALGLRTGLTHMEYFRRPDGSVAVSEVAVRPPGAQFTTMLSYAHDVDMYRAWAALMAFDVFDPPHRDYSVGAAYLRGQGTGTITGVAGLDELQEQIGHLVMESELPRIGAPSSGIYEGDGYVIVRDRDTGVVADALRRIVSEVHVEIGAAQGGLG